jgi:hypothetical protein
MGYGRRVAWDLYRVRSHNVWRWLQLRIYAPGDEYY